MFPIHIYLIHAPEESPSPYNTDIPPAISQLCKAAAVKARLEPTAILCREPSHH